MDFVELSIAELREKSNQLAQLVAADWRPDTRAYLAKGGYIIGLEMSRALEAELMEFSARRSGDDAKNAIAGFLLRCPKTLKRLLRGLEIRFRLRKGCEINRQKDIYRTRRFPDPKKAEKILIVDDSADTGASLKSAMELAKRDFPSADIKIAVINTFDEARKQIRIDWYLYENCLLGTPASKDNPEYKTFLAIYQNELPL